ncbi:MAG: oligosaccharide flippase family protein [Clostridia bacterium]|nr:oligosaccharide flippase family protein [Clostridia bacterium]
MQGLVVRNGMSMDTNRKNFTLNLLGQVLVFIINMVIGLFLTPCIVDALGTEAYGYIGIINNLISYLSVLTTSLNALAGRYITISYLKDDKKETNEYFTSVFFSNVVLGISIFVLSILLSVKLEALIHIPEHLVVDVKIAFVLAAVSSSISLLSVVWGVAAFIKNKLYLNSFAQVVAGIVRIVLLLVLFTFFTPRVLSYSLGGVVSGFIVLVIELLITRKILPGISIKRTYFSFKKVVELIKSGIWVSFQSLNKILQTGLDLFITNIFVDTISTGLFSIAKQIPVVLNQIPALLANIFNPSLARLYVKEQKDELVQHLNFTMKFLTFVMVVPLIGFVVFGDNFYALWLPNHSSNEIATIQLLSVLTVLPCLFDAYVQGLYYINVLTNKIRDSVLITFAFSVMSIVTEIVLLLATDLNPLMVIAATSSVFVSVRYLIVTPIYCAYILEIHKYTFFKQLIKSIVTSVVVFVLFYLTKKVLIIDTWVSFLTSIFVIGIVGYLVVFLITFTMVEKKKVLTMLKLDRILKRGSK